MCLDNECPQAKMCYRHEAKPDKRQSYFMCSPRWIIQNFCEDFMPIKEVKPYITKMGEIDD
jgi:hypothetical protein